MLLLLAAASADATVVGGTFFARALGVWKKYRVYLPEGYERGGQFRYPVIFLLHGWGGTQDHWLRQRDLERAASELGLQALVVMPDGDRSYYANAVQLPDYAACMADPSGANPNEPRREFCVHAQRYEDYVTRDLLAMIEADYRTIRSREARALSGEAAGGYGAMLLALRHRDKFSSVTMHSAFLSLMHKADRTQAGLAGADPGLLHTFGSDLARWRMHDPGTLAASLRPADLSIFFDAAEDEPGLRAQAVAFHERLTALDVPHRFEVIPAQHGEEHWPQRVRALLAFHILHFKQGHLHR